MRCLLIVLAYLTMVATSWSNFCSVVCGNNCNGDLRTNCNNNCQTDGAWVASGNTCAVKTAANWHMFDSTPDYGGGLTVTGATLTGFCFDFNFYGYVNPADQIIVETAGMTVPYYSIRIYVGILAHNSTCSGCGGNKYIWSSTSAFQINFNDPLGTQSASNPIVSVLKKSNSASGKCDNSNSLKSNWIRLSKTYSYSLTNQALSWTISCNETNTTAQWGIKEFLILYQSCHWACTTCFGPAATQCNSCVDNATNSYWLSNNTCNETCLSHFGYGIPYTCVYCDRKCVSCYMAADNCTSCTTSGIYSAYLSSIDNPNYETCVSKCTGPYFANKTSHVCDPCNSNCQTCVNNANYCTSCLSGLYWTGWMCYTTCPAHYFLDTSGTNCTKCYPYCDTCNGSYNICSVCTLSGQFEAYLYNVSAINQTCLRVCPGGYYGQNYNGTGPNKCINCDTNCSLCTGYPTPCTECITGFYLLGSICTDTCPNGTVGFNSSGILKCLSCDIYCVGLAITMYFPSIIQDQVYIDMTFSQSLNYSTFNMETFQNITITSQNIEYTVDMFTFTYVNISESIYRIVIAPKTYIFLYNATFTVTTKTQPSPKDQSLQKMPFKSTNYLQTASLTWFLIKGPPFTPLEVGIMSSLSTLSTKTNYILTLPYVQQIKKSGIFNLLFSGAQATSLSMLSNQIQSQNLYEGVRIWAIFVYFDAPPYEKISNKTKRFVSPTVEDKIRNAQEVSPTARQLFSTDSMYWRFQRTGQTSFFIYDVYIPIVMIVLCWLGMFVAHCCTKQKWYLSYASNLYSAVHKIHEISLMYITMAAIVQFLYYEPSSFQRIVSAIVCVVFNIYFLMYELYVYYDMIKYPLAEIGNRFYDYYVLRYGFFLKNVRFEEYDINQPWSPKHWFRPYNFHILSFYKKFLMVTALPLFYSTTYAQMAVLCFVQLLEVIRVWTVWPFLSKRRNWLKLSLEISLFLFFLINLVQINLLQTIMSGDAGILEKTTAVFYNLGWVGFACCCYFNLSFVGIGIYDLCVGLKDSNRSKMDKARKKYYFHKIRDYESENQASSKDLVSRWVKLGNLNDKAYGQLPEVNIRIEFYQFKKKGNKFELTIKKITNLKMKHRLKLHKPNNTTVGGKIERQMLLSQYDNERLFSILNHIYQRYQGPHVQTIRIKTFLNIWQKDYSQGEPIPLDRDLMFQKVELASYNNEVQQIRLESLLPGFPIPESTIEETI